MNGKLKIISLGILCIIMLLSCKTTRIEYSSDKFTVVETVDGDTFKGLAEKHLKDPEKDWLITEFNKTRELQPGKNIIIPLSFFNKGGLKATGCQVVPVLNYRGFSLKTGTGKQKVSEKEFSEQMRFLKDNGFRVIPASSLLDFIDYKIQLPEKAVVITITGNSNSFYDIAFPVIESFDYATTLFIDPERVGGDKKEAWTRIRELSTKGVNIQSCAGISGLSTGKNKGTIKDYFLRAEEKISQSKKEIETRIGKKCTLFAVPWGAENNLLTSILMKKGYQAAFIDNNKGNPFFVDKFGINATVINGGLMMDDFRKKVETFQNMDLN